MGEAPRCPPLVCIQPATAFPIFCQRVVAIFERGVSSSGHNSGLSGSPCASVGFGFVHLEALLSGHRPLGLSHPLHDSPLPLFLAAVWALEPALSDVDRAPQGPPVRVGLALLVQLFYFGLFVLCYLKGASYRERTVGSCFSIQFVNLSLI